MGFLNVFFLKDLSTEDIDAVILTHTTTKEDLEEIIDKIREDGDYECLFEKICEKLPQDCEVVETFGQKNYEMSIYY